MSVLSCRGGLTYGGLDVPAEPEVGDHGQGDGRGDLGAARGADHHPHLGTRWRRGGGGLLTSSSQTIAGGRAGRSSD